MLALFYRLPHTLGRIFYGRNLFWHALAIGLTVLMVASGCDWQWFCWTRVHWIITAAWPGIVIGGLLPLVGTLSLILTACVIDRPRVQLTGWALGQAALLGWLVSSGYKAFTGRLPPPMDRNFTTLAVPLVDSSHGFQLGWWHGGIFWGWPSGHTTVAFAMAVTLVTLHGQSKWVRAAALAYALYIGLAVSVTIHWASEFVAGAIFGSLIGREVGRAFVQRPVARRLSPDSRSDA